MVLDFIGKLKLNHYNGNYVFSIATCGGSIANTMKLMDASLKKKTLKLNGEFSIIMPNNYILMGEPQWRTKCSQCLACVHYCPSKAIEYGTGTVKKGRYTHPQVSVMEMSHT